MRAGLTYRRFVPLLLCAALGLLAPACYGTVSGGYVDVAYAPANYAAYPSYYYDGANVYYIDGRWYRYDRGHWGYYRSEPRELYRYRSGSRVYVAPEAHHRHYNTYQAPPRRDDHYYRAPSRERRVYSAPPRRDDRHYSAPPRRESRDDRHYRAPSGGDRHHHHGRD